MITEDDPPARRSGRSQRWPAWPRAHAGSLASTLREYPLPALLVMAPQYALSGGVRSYLVLFCGSMLACDAAFTFSPAPLS